MDLSEASVRMRDGCWRFRTARRSDGDGDVYNMFGHSTRLEYLRSRYRYSTTFALPFYSLPFSTRTCTVTQPDRDSFDRIDRVGAR